MSRGADTIVAGSDRVVLEQGQTCLEVTMEPLRFSVTRAGHALLRDGRIWVADGRAADQFIRLSEGVLPHETLEPREWAERGTLEEHDEEQVRVTLVFSGGRRARLEVSLAEPDLVAFKVEAEGEPLRTALEWEQAPGEGLVGLGRAMGSFSIRTAGRCSLEQTGATRDPIARVSCSPPAGSRRATAPRFPGCSRATATRRSSRRRATAHGSSSTGAWRCQRAPPAARWRCSCCAPPPRPRAFATSAG